MTTTKHYAGRLKVIESDDKGWGGFFGLVPVRAEDEAAIPDLCVAVVSYGGGGSEADGDPWGDTALVRCRAAARVNAELLAVAPEMVDALRNLVSFDPGVNHSGILRAIRENARALLARLDGEE